MRYEFRRGKAAKFWEVEVSGVRITTRFGKLGTTGQQQRKTLATPKQAQREHERMVTAKLEAGYSAVTQAAAATAATGASKSGKRAPDLERAIAADPDGVDAYLVYGDWLQGAGDPRGELIAIQAARARTPKDAALVKAERALLKMHAEVFFGTLAKAAAPGMHKSWGRAPFFVEWHCGFFRSARCSCNDIFGIDATAPWMLERLWDLPSAKFLRRMSFGSVDSDGMVDYRQLIAQLVSDAKRAPATLRELHLGDFAHEEWEVNWAHVGKVGALAKAYPRLHRLALEGSDIDLEKLDHAELRELALHSDSGVGALGPALDRAKLPKLERLRVTLGPNTGELEIEAVLDGRFPALRHLELGWVDLTRDQLERLAKGKTLAKLETLALASGALTDTKAEVIAAHADRFAHLPWIDLDNNLFTRRGRKLLGTLCKDVRFGEQQPYDDVFEWSD